MCDISRPLTINEFKAATGVLAVTLEHLEKYKSTLTQWQKRVNLVSSKSLEDFWRRHMLDSAQLFLKLNNVNLPIYDLGSGAGFPGLVLAVMGIKNIHLVESDNRKCTFLHEVNAQTGAGVTIHNVRIEELITVNPGVVISRALAPLDILLEYAAPLLSDAGFCLFLKGRRMEQELAVVQKKWMTQTEQYDSLTDPTGIILKINNVSRKNYCESNP